MNTVEPKFLCDEMLKGLVKWLRAAGYDTIVGENGVNDHSLLNIAKIESRVLLTRDRHFKTFVDKADTVILLDCNSTLACARELTRYIEINWLNRPFSRCLICNYPLKLADESYHVRVPEKSLEFTHEIYRCSQCDKLYWEGTHVRRMKRVLTRLNIPL